MHEVVIQERTATGCVCGDSKLISLNVIDD